MRAPSPIKLLGISGSLRARSYNSGALSVVGSVLPEDVEFDVASLTDIPFYNADVEQRGFPAEVESFRRKVAVADALIFAVPEYMPDRLLSPTTNMVVLTRCSGPRPAARSA